MSLEQAGAGGRQCGGWLRSFCSRALRCGQIPRHVAIIMDGNRRFARKMQYERSFQGHVSGFDKLMETLEWCLELGITELTVYAFSIENFKRSREEVEGLMELAKAKIARLLEERDIIHRHGVRVRALGNLELLPSDVLEAVARVANFSRDNTRAVLNVCFSYTARQEMVEAVRRLARGVREGRLLPSDVSEELFGRCLYTEDSAPPDLVIRTSGEVRLSDFLLWQSSYSHLCFQEVLWPEFSVWNLFSAILTYQKSYEAIQAARRGHWEWLQRTQADTDYAYVLSQWSAGCEAEPGVGVAPEDIESLVQAHAVRREERVDLFLKHLRGQYRTFLEKACPLDKI